MTSATYSFFDLRTSKDAAACVEDREKVIGWVGAVAGAVVGAGIGTFNGTSGLIFGTLSGAATGHVWSLMHLKEKCDEAHQLRK
jgi:uncharacterized protein YcfJ